MIEVSPDAEYTDLHLGPPFVGQTLRVGTTVFYEGKWHGTVDEANLLMRFNRFYPVRRGTLDDYQEDDGIEIEAGPVEQPKAKKAVTRRKVRRKKKAAAPDVAPAQDDE